MTTNREFRRRRPLRRKAVILLTVVSLLTAATTSVATAQDAAPTCAGKKVTVVVANGDQATEGDDVILGTPEDDVIDGLGGDDTICGGEGKDRIDGGAGHDRLYGQQDGDVLRGGPGNDSIYGQQGWDTLKGGHGNDVIRGGTGKDTIFGGTGADSIEGNKGSDTIDAGNGNDTVTAGHGDDAVNGGKGNDTIAGGDGSDELHGGEGDDELSGDTGDDRLDGGPGINDSLDGGVGTDWCALGTTSDCELPTVQKPQWLSDAALDLKQVSRWDFRFSWCCLYGGEAAPDLFEIIIRDSSGAENKYTRSASSPWEMTVDRFDGYALEEGGVYEVEVFAVNAAGRTMLPNPGVIGLPEIIVEVVEDHGTGTAPADAVDGRAATSRSDQENCKYRDTRLRIKARISSEASAFMGLYATGLGAGPAAAVVLALLLGKTVEIGSFRAMTDACMDGTTVTENFHYFTPDPDRASSHCDLTFGIDALYSEELEINGVPYDEGEELPRVDHAPLSVNNFECTIIERGQIGWLKLGDDDHFQVEHRILDDGGEIFISSEITGD